MSVPDEILDEAFAIYREFGPDSMIDRKQRLQGEFKQLTSEELDLVLARMKEVSQTVGELAQQGGDAKLGKEKVVALLQEKHPFLKDKGLKNAVFLVNYIAWHDAY